MNEIEKNKLKSIQIIIIIKILNSNSSMLNKSNKTDREITDECNESEILLINQKFRVS